MADEREEALDHFIDTLLEGGRPAPDGLVGEEAPVARLAAELSAASSPERGEPDPAFVEQLRLRMRDADEGLASVRGWTLPADSALQRVRLTRRDLLRVGIGAAAGLAAGAGAIAILRPTAPLAPSRTGNLVDQGQWVAVATLADVPVGGAVRFSTVAFDGYVVNDAGTIRALSSVCTHMGCTLAYRPAWHDLRCPCHGASFNLSGELANGSAGWSSGSGYAGDERAYPLDLPPLVRPRVKVSGETVLVWTASA